MGKKVRIKPGILNRKKHSSPPVVSDRGETGLAVLSPVTSNPRIDMIDILTDWNASDLYTATQHWDPADIVALDIETMGTEAHDSSIAIVGIGLAGPRFCCYFDRASAQPGAWEALLSRCSQMKLIAHNLLFDGAFLLRDYGWMNWQYCTYGLYKHLATEGYNGQKWGLKNAQIELLNWQETNEKQLDDWLIDNAWVKGSYGDRANGSEELKEWIREGKKEGKVYPPNKGEMYRAPANILGYYCALDADSTFQIYDQVFQPVLKRFKEYDWFHKEIHLDTVKALAEQQLRGVRIDGTQLYKYRVELDQIIEDKLKLFTDNPIVSPFIKQFNERKLAEVYQTEPEKHLKKKKAPKEPPQLKKNGEISQAWLTWQERYSIWEAMELTLSKNWILWNDRYEEAKTTMHFNFNSKHHLRELFYDYLGNPIIVTTDTGEPAVSKKSLPAFGEPGILLKTYNDTVKELSYVEGCLEKIGDTDVLHTQYRAPGTLTGRLAGSGGLNVQQLPKSRGYLECWKPRPGMTWIDCDHSALEQVVMAELTKDETLWKLYGPDAVANDVYLFNGANLPIIGEKIRATGYDPDNPTMETIAHAKKIAKKERSIAKVFTLASSYGAGAKKIQESLALSGVSVSLQDCRNMFDGYWKLYGGVKDYERFLKKEWTQNGGWVLNGIGRPIGVAEDRQKDLVNRVVQSTGHDLHQIWVRKIRELQEEMSLDFWGIIWDFHDQTIVECPEDQAEQVLDLVGRLAYDRLQEEVQAEIPLKGDPQIVRSLAEAKLED